MEVKQRSGEVESHTMKNILKIHCAFRSDINRKGLTSVREAESGNYLLCPETL